jgi:anti-sigma B factor antagonist
MELTLTEGQNQLRITLGGNIDEAGAEKLGIAFKQLYNRPAREIVLDFGDVVHIGSAGMGQLLLLYKNVAMKGGEIRIEKSSPTVRELLRIVKIDDLMTVVG